MESINRIQKGVNSDFNENAQPEGTLRHSLNGRLNALGGGMYSWTTMKGNTLAFSTTAGFIIAICSIRNYLYYFTTLSGRVSLFKVQINDAQDGIVGSPILIVTYASGFNYNYDHPIRAMFGYYENEDVQRIYLTDFHSKPKVIDLINPQVIKFIDFTPIMDTMGTFSFQDILSGGSLYYGTYFVAFRLYNADGYYSDWSFHSNPINVTDNNRGSTPDNYHDFTGGSSTFNSGNKIRIDINNLDTDYDNIQVAYFRAIGYNAVEPGVIALDTTITTSSMTFDILGLETIGTVIIDDLILTSITVMKCKEMFPIKGYNTIFNLEERPELNLPASLGYTVEEEKYEIVLDAVSGADPVTNLPPLYIYPDDSTNLSFIYAGRWYRADTNGSYDRKVAGTTVNFTSGDRIMPDEFGINVVGTLVPILRIKKYRKGSATVPYTDSDYEWDEIEVDGLYPNYKDPLVAHHLKGYPANTTIRIGILFYDLEGKPFFARHAADFTTSNRHDFGFTTLYSLDTSGGEGDDYHQTNGNIISLKVSDIDITDFHDQISGFSVVRTIIPETKIGTGVLVPVVLGSGTNYKTWYGMYGAYNSGNRKANSYVLYSPEHLFNGFKAFVPNDKIRNVSYMIPLRTSAIRNSLSGFGVEDYSGFASKHRKMHQKFYIKRTVDGTGNGARGSENKIDEVVPYNFLDDGIAFDTENPSYTFDKKVDDISVPLPAAGLNPRMLILKTENDESGITDPNNKAVAIAAIPEALIVDIVRNAIGYGGSDDANLSTMQYITVGHFQPINAAVLADILNAGSYIFNEVQFFGGDHYLCMFDINRVIADENDTFTGSHSILIPLETKLNLDLRQGKKFAQLQTYDAAGVTDGLLYDSSVPTVSIEEFILNHSYSTDTIGDFYPGLPYNQSLQNVHDVMSRYSEHKVNGENKDSFRRFLTNNYRELDPRFGAITGAAANGNYIVTWQPDSIGYIPISERQMGAGEFGQPIQMGVGQMFQIDDSIIEMLGNSHQFGLINTPNGFIWFDAKRASVLKMDRSMKITVDSILSGYREVLDQYFDRSLLGEDNPIHYNGISGGYEPAYGMAYLTFIQPINSFTLGFDSLTGFYTGRYSFLPRIYHYFREVMVTIKSYQFYIHDRGDYSTFFGIKYQSEFSVIVKDPAAIALKYDNLILADNGKNFSAIEYNNYVGTAEDILTNLAGVLTTRDYNRIRNELRGSIALVSTQRFDGAWLKITFKIYATRTDNEQIEFYQLITKSRHGW